MKELLTTKNFQILFILLYGISMIARDLKIKVLLIIIMSFLTGYYYLSL